MKLYQLVTIFYIIVYTESNFMRHKYRVDIDKILACPDNESLESPIRNLVFRKINRTTKALSYDVTFVHPLDENVGGAAYIGKLTNGKWERVPLIPVQPYICKVLESHFNQIFLQNSRAMGYKEPITCPLPAGNFSVRNQVLDTSTLAIPFWEGKYRFNLEYTRTDNKRKVYCQIFEVNIVEILNGSD